MRIIVIGGGIVGLATAFRLGQSLKKASVTVLEKESGVGQHQSGHNSGVLHCGLYYKPGSLKARLAVSGIRQMIAFCQEHSIPHEICGKLVVATNPEQASRLRGLFERGQQNGLRGLQMLSPDEMCEIEPYARGVAAIRVPEEGIVDYGAVCEALVRCIQAHDGEVVTQSCVVRLESAGPKWVAQTATAAYEADYIVNCAGLHCDRVCRLTGDKPSSKIVPFRGEYYKLRTEREFLVRNLIYPVPDPRFPFLGVHFTRLIRGGIEAGPNAVLALKREGYAKSDFSARDVIDTLTYPGFWRFFGRYPHMCWNELRRSFSKELFCQSLQALVPDVRPDDLAPGGAGVRAQAITPGGETLQDFSFVRGERALHVLNAPSPGATASLAIGQEIANEVASAR
ncbi:MAG TPA: L-2-hydroxyglutarate oxidase [Bryobacteraceae bacterium]|nr:L-2-hydroxyglutarate oxidase [Bryobacteraceae bacterium]